MEDRQEKQYVSVKCILCGRVFGVEPEEAEGTLLCEVCEEEYELADIELREKEIGREKLN